jgi:hypothetical protein
MGRPAEYRKHARECIELAEKTTKEHHRAMLLGMAEKWFQLATVVQRDSDLIADDGR